MILHCFGALGQNSKHRATFVYSKPRIFEFAQPQKDRFKKSPIKAFQVDSLNLGCWHQLARRGDDLYFLHSNTEEVHLIYSSNGGRSWKHDRVDHVDNYNLEDDQARTVTVNGHTATVPRKAQFSYHRASLQIDSKGNPHLAYIISYSNVFKRSHIIYAVKRGGEWQREKLMNNGDFEVGYVGHDVDMVLDTRDNPHFTFCVYKEGVNYLRKENGKWKRSIVIADSTFNWPGMAIELDRKGHPHIVIAVSIDGQMRYATSTDGGKNWFSEIVAATWWECDLAMDSQDQPHIVFNRISGGTYHTVKENGSWQEVKIGPGGQTCRPIIGIDQEDGLHVGYYATYQRQSGPLYYIHSEDGNNWEQETVDDRVHNGCSSATPGMVLDLVEWEEDTLVEDTLDVQLADLEKVGDTAEVEVNEVSMDFDQREVDDQHIIDVNELTVSIWIWDNAQVDGDTVSIQSNEGWILENYPLTKVRKRIDLTIDPEKGNRIVLHALNEGRIPPNTASVMIKWGKRTERIKLSSDMATSGAILFRYEEP